MIFNTSTSLLVLGLLKNNYCQLLNNLDLPIKLLEKTHYYRVHWGRSLTPPLKPLNAQSVQQVNYFLV